MSYRAVGNVSATDRYEVLKLIKQLRDTIDERFGTLDKSVIESMRTDLTALELKINSIEAEQQEQNDRLSMLEATAATDEITPEEVLEMYGGNNG